MGRKPLTDRPLTPAERQARRRDRRTQEASKWQAALMQIKNAKTVREAREIATAALSR